MPAREQSAASGNNRLSDQGWGYGSEQSVHLAVWGEALRLKVLLWCVWTYSCDSQHHRGNKRRSSQSCRTRIPWCESHSSCFSLVLNTRPWGTFLPQWEVRSLNMTHCSLCHTLLLFGHFSSLEEQVQNNLEIYVSEKQKGECGVEEPSVCYNPPLERTRPRDSTHHLGERH